jgi:hypothetical protein
MTCADKLLVLTLYGSDAWYAPADMYLGLLSCTWIDFVSVVRYRTISGHGMYSASRQLVNLFSSDVR